MFSNLSLAIMIVAVLISDCFVACYNYIITIDFHLKNVNFCLGLLYCVFFVTHPVHNELHSSEDTPQNSGFSLNIKSHQISPDPHWLLEEHLVDEPDILCGGTLDVFCVSMVTRPHSTQDNNESSQRPQGHHNSARPQRFSFCGTWRSYTT